ncbi:hypothetical protein BBM91_12750 [Vibrio parahaemolyticus]|nr:hypothetical protein BBM91_12750 [Vibrio parahaemolyticus]
MQQMLAEYQAQSNVPQELCDRILEAAKESSVGEGGVRSQVKIRRPKGKNHIRYEYDLDHIDCEKNEITFYRHINYSGGFTREFRHAVSINDFVNAHVSGEIKGLVFTKRGFPTKSHKRSVDEVNLLRKEFESIKPEFVRCYASTKEAAKRFTSKQLVKMIKSGRLPDEFIIHHKTPLFRGGDNSFDNFRVMNSKFHQKYNKRLYWYDEGKNIYQK